MAGSVGALIRDGGGASPSLLLGAIKVYVGSSTNWARITSTGSVVRMLARLLSIDSTLAASVFIAAYSDARQNQIVEILGGVLVVGVDEAQTWNKVSEILGHLTGLGQTFQPSVDRLYIRSPWDLGILLIGSVGTFVASSAVIEAYLPGGALLWTTVALGFIAGTAVAQWIRKG